MAQIIKLTYLIEPINVGRNLSVYLPTYNKTVAGRILYMKVDCHSNVSRSIE